MYKLQKKHSSVVQIQNEEQQLVIGLFSYSC